MSVRNTEEEVQIGTEEADEHSEDAQRWRQPPFNEKLYDNIIILKINDN